MPGIVGRCYGLGIVRGMLQARHFEEGVTGLAL